MQWSHIGYHNFGFLSTDPLRCFEPVSLSTTPATNDQARMNPIGYFALILNCIIDSKLSLPLSPNPFYMQAIREVVDNVSNAVDCQKLCQVNKQEFMAL